ncbi:hypothetical protein D9M73_249980 [compost metagenome]
MGEGVTAREHRGMMGNIGKGHRVLQYQVVLGGGDEIQWVVPHRNGLDQAVRFRGQGNNGQFGAAMEDFFVGYF